MAEVHVGALSWGMGEVSRNIRNINVYPSQSDHVRLLAETWHPWHPWRTRHVQVVRYLRHSARAHAGDGEVTSESWRLEGFRYCEIKNCIEIGNCIHSPPPDP